MSNEFGSVHAVIGDGIARAVAVVGLAGIALIHLLDAPGTFEGSAYKGWLYVGLITGCIVAGAVLIRRSDPRAWAAAAMLASGAIVAFVVSRTIGLRRAPTISATGRNPWVWPRCSSRERSSHSAGRGCAHPQPFLRIAR